jgi:hypothetical protein
MEKDLPARRRTPDIYSGLTTQKQALQHRELLTAFLPAMVWFLCPNWAILLLNLKTDDYGKKCSG